MELETRGKKIGFVFQSNVDRMFAHAGGMIRAHEGFDCGELCRPYGFYTCSGGAIAGSATMTRASAERFIATLDVIRPRDIYHLDYWLLTVIGLEILESFASVIDNPMSPSWFRKLTRYARPVISLGVKSAFAERFFRMESFLSNDPLLQLLSNRLDFDAIFASPIKLAIAAANIQTGQLEKFTNYLPEDTGKREKLIQGIGASSALPAYFPTVRWAGRQYIDGAVIASAPMQWAIDDGCDEIWLLSYTGLDQRDSQKYYTSWFDILYRSLDIAVTEHTRTMVEQYIQMNHDNLLARNLGIETQGFSFHNRPCPKIIVVAADEPLPTIDFRTLDHRVKRKLMEIGYAAMDAAIVSNR